jgi:hypothetical protein
MPLAAPIRNLPALLLVLAPPLYAEVTIEPVRGQDSVTIEYSGATDFSGLTWLEGDNYYAVSNRDRAMFAMKISVATETGRLTDARFTTRIPLKTGYSDLEGIAYQPETKRVYLSSESAHGIVGFDRAGDASFSVNTVPAIFKTARENKSLESLTYGARSFWTANEDTLKVDGEMSSAKAGALVRLQKFDAKFQPLAQYAYRTETSLFRVRNSGTGVPDLCALPNGNLLVLERVVGLGLSAKIYLVDFQGATDTTKTPRLDRAQVNPVRKTLLFERATGFHNFEGITLGPELAGGWRSLLLISDSDGAPKHTLMPLRIKWSE